MSDVSVWRLFAFMDSDQDGERDESRRLAEWQLQDALRHCVTRGYDHVYLCRVPGEVARWTVAAPGPVSHHMHLVTEGSKGEPAGDAAA